MRKNNKEIIVTTARRLFLKYGYNGISIRAIAKETKMTTGAVYFHFKNKMDIYKSICFEAIDLLTDKFKKAVESRKTVNQKLISTFDSYLKFFYDHNDYYNILMEYKAAYGKESDLETDEITTKLSELMDIKKSVIEQGIEEGKFRDIDPTMMSVLLATIAEGILQYKKLGLFDYHEVNDKDFRKFMADIIWKGIQKSDTPSEE